jgi:hypothetical protein
MFILLVSKREKKFYRLYKNIGACRGFGGQALVVGLLFHESPIMI